MKSDQNVNNHTYLYYIALKSVYTSIRPCWPKSSDYIPFKPECDLCNVCMCLDRLKNNLSVWNLSALHNALYSVYGSSSNIPSIPIIIMLNQYFIILNKRQSNAFDLHLLCSTTKKDNQLHHLTNKNKHLRSAFVITSFNNLDRLIAKLL